MGTALFGRRVVMLGVIVSSLLIFLAARSDAQTGQVKGRVVDGDGNPIEGATVVIEYLGALTRRHETKTNRRGDYVQIGLQSGDYRVTVSKDAMSQGSQINVRAGQLVEADFVLTPGSRAPITPEQAAEMKAKMEAVAVAFNEGVALSNEGRDEEAIAKFKQILTEAPTCGECYVNIGAIYARTKRYGEAEAAFKQATEVSPNLVDAWNGLANVYNAQRKFDEAAQASQKAAELSTASGQAGAESATTFFNQGVILWNSGKIPEAKKQFEEAVRLDPSLAEAHYWLGMANVNEGDLAGAVTEFEQYLQLDPNGKFAEQAKGIVAQLKK